MIREKDKAIASYIRVVNECDRSTKEMQNTISNMNNEINRQRRSKNIVIGGGSVVVGFLLALWISK